jgi:hypothetical protein
MIAGIPSVMSLQNSATAGVGTIAPSFEYDAFISYRRGDGTWHAQTLRQRLQDVRVPPEVRSARSDGKLRIYLDQIYERATDDFFEDTIKPALAASRNLVVVKTASAMNALPDGRENWLVREIDYFRSLPPEGRKISVAVASGDLTGALPGRLDETHPNIERLDLRRWRWYRAPAIDDPLLSLAATLHEISPAEMPALRQEDARRHAAQRRTRRIVGAIAITLVLAATLAAVWQYLRVREETSRRNIAMASSLWNRLNFTDSKRIAADNLNALWEVRLANATLREAFITELTNGGDRGTRLGRRPSPVLRALYLQWPEEQAARAFDAVMRDTATTDVLMQDPLWQASDAVARELPAGRVEAAMTSVLDATKGRTERRAFPTMRALAGKVTTSQAQAILAPLLKQIETATDPVTLKAYWVVIWAFGSVVTPDQATLIRAAAVRAFERTNEPDELEVLSHAVGALPGALTTEEARRVLAIIAKQISETTRALPTLGDAIAGLATALPDDEARQAFDLVLPKLDGADQFASNGLAAAVVSLAPRLRAERARTAVERVAWATGRARDDDTAESLIGAMSAVSERLSAGDAQAVVPTLLATLSRTPADLPAASIEGSVNTMVARLEPPAAQNWLALTLFSFGTVGATAFDTRVLTPAVRAIAPQLTDQQRAALTQRVCARVQSAPDSTMLMTITAVASALHGTCALPAEATPSLERLLASANTEDVFKGVGAAQSFALMAQMVTSEQARALVTPALAVLEHQDGGPMLYFVATALRSWFDRGMLTEADAARVRSVALARMNVVKQGTGLREFATLTSTLPGRLTPEQSQAALTSLLKADQESAALSDIFESRRLIAEAILALAPQLTAEQRQSAGAAMRTELAWAETDESAIAAARAAIALAPREADEFAPGIIEMLKYPAAAGPATDLLLAALHEVTARGADSQPDLTFASLRASFPRANLDSPPACPPSSHGGLVCPAAGR